MRYFIELSYKGTRYNGWQIQNNAPSVQGELQRALSTILKCDTNVTGAGRTDTGVHALYYVAHFDFNEGIENKENLIYHLNSILPGDISIMYITNVCDGVSARFSAIEREYTYVIITNKNVFRRDTSWQYYVELDVVSMNQAAGCLLQYDDFTSFAKLNSANKTNICHIKHAKWVRINEHEICFTIRADRFLRNMVRAIVWTLVEVGRHKRSVNSFAELIEAKNLSLITGSAPAQGLFLSNIEYPDDIYLQM